MTPMPAAHTLTIPKLFVQFLTVRLNGTKISNQKNWIIIVVARAWNFMFFSAGNSRFPTLDTKIASSEFFHFNSIQIYQKKEKLNDKTGSKDCGNYTAVDTKKKCIPIIFEANAADRLDSFKAKQKKIVVMTVKMGDRNNRVESNNVRNIFRQLLCKWH